VVLCSAGFKKRNPAYTGDNYYSPKPCLTISKDFGLIFGRFANNRS
jgi:hypothetical protein